MKTTLTAVALLGFVASSSMAFAMGNEAETRQMKMKQVGGATGAIVKMMKGQVDFDAAQALAQLQIMNDVANEFGSLFPEGSETGANTEASPAIWSNRAGFDAAVEQFKTDTAAAVAANPQDVGALQASFGAIGKNCQSCHQDFRVKN